MSGEIHEVWSIVVYDCNDRLVGLYATREIAEQWLEYLTNRGVQCIEVVGPHPIRFGAPS